MKLYTAFIKSVSTHDGDFALLLKRLQSCEDDVYIQPMEFYLESGPQCVMNGCVLCCHAKSLHSRHHRECESVRTRKAHNHNICTVLDIRQTEPESERERERERVCVCVHNIPVSVESSPERSSYRVHMLFINPASPAYTRDRKR